MPNHQGIVEELSGFNPLPPTGRGRLACQACRKLHMKCSGRKPCSRCTLQARVCTYISSRRGPNDNETQPGHSEPADQSVIISPGNRPRRANQFTYWMKKPPILSSLSVLGSGRVDPFSLQCKTIGTRFHDLTDYCIKILWPEVRPARYAAETYRSWIHGVRSPALVHSILFSSSLHRDFKLFTTGNRNLLQPSKEQLQDKSLALKSVREALLGSTTDYVSDEILLSILFLAVNENSESISERDVSPFTPPFTELQCLDYYGSCDYNPIHWTIIQKSIEYRGGLHHVKLYGTAYLVSIAGLMYSVNTVSKPIFPMLDPSGNPLTWCSPLEVVQIPENRRHSSISDNGFHQLALLEPPIKWGIIKVFLDLSELSQALQFLCHNTCGPMASTSLGDCRNLLQHRLFSLPNSRQTPFLILENEPNAGKDISITYAIYVSCRLTALLYSIHVTYPLPRTIRLRQILLPELQSNMNKHEAAVHDAQVLKILLWCAMIGGMVAEGSDQRRWFVAKISKLCSLLKVENWTTMVGVLKSFAWLDSACNQAGRAVWLEANMLCLV